MTDQKKGRRAEIKCIAEKYLIRERDPALRTKQPLPADYQAFRDEYSGNAGYVAIKVFEEAWAKLYDAQSA